MQTGEPESRSSGPRHLDRWLLVALMLIALTARLVPGERTVDDAYITFRYARNLLEGRGFVYNPGERVLGTTTPLYTLLLAGLSLASSSRDFPALALRINALAGALSVGLLYALGKRFAGHRAPAVAVALLWALTPYSVTFAVGGMETDPTIALLLAAAYTHIAGKPRALAILSALALLARPDTAILLSLLWLDLLIARRRVPWREGAITLALLAPWLVFGTLYFGSPLTGSIAAKSAAYRLPPGSAFVRLLQTYATPFFEREVISPYGVFVLLVLYLALCAMGSRDGFRRNHRTWPISVYPFAYFAVFSAANPLIFRWYMSPPLPFYFLLILTGAWTIIRDITTSVVGRLVVGKSVHWDTNHPIPNFPIPNFPITNLPIYPFILLAAAALALTLNAWTLHPDHGPDRPAPEMAWFKLELLYARAADIVLAHAAPGDTLCAGDIGVLGYRTDMRVLDTVGLVTPETASHYPADSAIYVINYAIPADLVLALDPDYIVILEVYGRLGLLPDPRFQARYRLLEKIETDIYGSKGMLIFERRYISKVYFKGDFLGIPGRRGYLSGVAATLSTTTR